MNLKIVKEKRLVEAIIDDDCSFDTFYTIANILQTDFNLSFMNKLKHLDTIYWDLNYHGSKLSLHFNVLAGIAIFPIAFENARDLENDNVIKIGNLLSPKVLRLRGI